MVFLVWGLVASHLALWASGTVGYPVAVGVKLRLDEVLGVWDLVFVGEFFCLFPSGEFHTDEFNVLGVVSVVE